VQSVLTVERVRAVQDVPEKVHVDDDLLGYMADVARATRQDHRVDIGVSPRGTQRLLETSRARAVLHGREFVTPDDVKAVARPALGHRLVLTPDARVEGVEKLRVIDDVLDEVPVPTID
jgi:MoxR-like ATPase